MGEIVGSEKLTGIFGSWPSFHDAEVLNLHLWRGDVDAERGRWVFPVLTLDLYVWELTREVNEMGFMVLRKHTRTTLRFEEVHGLELHGFNHVNSILDLEIKRPDDMAGRGPRFAVKLQQAFGLGASFACDGVTVMYAKACDEYGKVF